MGCHLAVFSEGTAFICYFVDPNPPPPFNYIGVLVALAMLVKPLKWWAIQVAIHSIVGAWIEYK